MRRDHRRRATGRRGVTLLEMLVVVALVVLMMLILASIFQAATGAMTSMRTYQELDDNLRLLDLTIRQDLIGSTARMTPPNNPLNKTGYFEYGEGAPADAQGEDTDDYLAFTVKAPEGQVFTGRCWIKDLINAGQTNANGTIPFWNPTIMPVTITSQYAEVIYFLRNGNLYRRVLLIVPERNGSLSSQSVGSGAGTFNPNNINGGLSGNVNLNQTAVSWYAVNDISARPTDVTDSATHVQRDGQATITSPGSTPSPNDLGDLTNREYRFARQRFARDYFDYRTGAFGSRDGVLDDANNDLLADYYPTLTWTQVLNVGPLLNEGSPAQRFNQGTAMPDMYSFPFLFPGMYSKPEAASLDSGAFGPVGNLHALDINTVAGAIPPNSTGVIFNHAPVEFGDSLPVPTGVTQQQTWWGFPTWRETASLAWQDPIYSPTSPSLTNTFGHQTSGLQYRSPSTAAVTNTVGLLPSLGSLPPLGTVASPATPFGSETTPPATRATAAAPNSFIVVPSTTTAAAASIEQLSLAWEDDLIMTGVRSFDVKAYDQNAPLYNLGAVVYAGGDYKDLGYASTDYTANLGAANNPLLTGTPSGITDGAYGNINGTIFGNPMGFGHEGRMPPLVGDLRLDPQRPVVNPTGSSIPGLANNVGDNTVGLMRLRRVWDSWSTDYTNAPAVDVNLRGSPIQAGPADRPVFPSYPAPYPQPLRGLQIQIRVVDPKNEKVKVLTIRHDFSDKL